MSGANFALTSIFLISVILAPWYWHWRVGHIGVLTAPDKALIAGLLALGIVALVVRIKAGRWAKRALLYVIYIGVLTEIGLHLLAGLGLIPGLSYFYHSPYARVYDADECLGNSRMNRHGWYYPEIDFEAKGRKIVLIGDSFIQGLQVQPEQNVGKALERRVCQSKSEVNVRTSVISLGIGNIGPGGYLELLKYAVKYLKPQEVFIFICLCNDFRDSSYELNKGSPFWDHLLGIYYYVGPKGELVLHPQSEASLKRFNMRLDANHRSLWFHIPGIIRNNSMIAVVLKEMFDAATKRVRHKPAPAASADLGGCYEPAFRRIWSRETEEAFTLATVLLERCDDYAVRHGITLRFVTIPAFPEEFLATADWENWGLEKGKYDFLKPEDKLTAWGREEGISVLPMGRFLEKSGLDAAELTSLFCLAGPSHWSRKGHDFWARAIYRTYYDDPKQDQ